MVISCLGGFYFFTITSWLLKHLVEDVEADADAVLLSEVDAVEGLAD